MLARQRIAIVGCGTGGPAAALFLHEAGHEVVVFDQFEKPEAVGAGLLLQPTGLQALAELGLAQRISERGAIVDRLYSHTAKGRTILDLSYTELDPEAHGVGVHRALLHDTLLRALAAKGIEVRLGIAVDKVQQSDDGAELFEDGTQLGSFDAVVVANGARSELRSEVIPTRVKPYSWGALWFVGATPMSAQSRCLHQVVRGSREMLGMLPTGTTPSDETPLTSMFWSLRLDTMGALRDRGIGPWKATVAELNPTAGELVSEIESFDEMNVASYRHVLQYPWHRGRVVVIGDAAHAMSPQLGQGANLALCDARELGRCISGASSIPEALHQYSQARKAHLRFYQRATRWLTPLFQSSWRINGWLRDFTFPIANVIGPLRRQGVRTMSGTKLGFVRSSLPTPKQKLPAPR